ncbi:MAG: 3'-5' exonuclease, partial [Coriobacteriales bacterium]|nr:3'-5' exonuclease [Coriobacteriales bacterium]
MSKIEKYLTAGCDPDVVCWYSDLVPLSQKIFAKDQREPYVYVVCDTETTGLDTKNDSIIEIAAIIWDGKNILDSFQTFVNPLKTLPPEITELTGITPEDIKDAPLATVAVEDFYAFAGDLDIVAHNASFDKSMLEKEVKDKIPKNNWIDSLEFARTVLPKFKNFKLKTLGEAFELSKPSHRAMDDVITTAQLMNILCTAVAYLPYGAQNFLATYAPQTAWSLRQIFVRYSQLSDAEKFKITNEAKYFELQNPVAKASPEEALKLELDDIEDNEDPLQDSGKPLFPGNEYRGEFSLLEIRKSRLSMYKTLNKLYADINVFTPQERKLDVDEALQNELKTINDSLAAPDAEHVESASSVQDSDDENNEESLEKSFEYLSNEELDAEF